MMHFRRIYFINKKLQTRFILTFVLIMICWAVATVGVYTYLVAKKLDSIRYSSHVDIKTTAELLLPITLGTHLISFLIFAAILAIVMHLVWKILSPPLYSLKKDLARIASGDLTSKVSLCEGEEFQDLASEVEKMRLGLSENIVRIKDQQLVLSTIVTEISNSISAGNLSMNQVVSLQSEAARLKESVQMFQC
jgi:methyl-accepting chemotaxis protein